jgi:hypothetical protein
MAIKIKKSHEGLFTAKAKRAGKPVQEYAREEAHDPKASPATRKQANFARMAGRHFAPLSSLRRVR